MNNLIKCPKCNNEFEANDAFKHQFESRLEQAKGQLAEGIKKEFEQKTKEATEKAVKDALAKERQEAEDLRIQNELDKEALEALRKDKKDLSKKLRDAQTAKEDAQEAALEMLQKERANLREQGKKAAYGEMDLKMQEKDLLISQLTEQLTQAKRTAEQGSQQLQGEVLELDVEHKLRNNFPFDAIDEVKKFRDGADIHQKVNAQVSQDCGLIIWECKNAKNFGRDWIQKLKTNIVDAGAQFGVIVYDAPDGGGEAIEQLEGNVWKVRRGYVVPLAGLLRTAVIQVDIVNRNNANRGTQAELIFEYITSTDFKNKLNAVIETFEKMRDQLTTERKRTEAAWGVREEHINRLISGIAGTFGHLQGIAGSEVLALPILEDEDEN